MLSCDAPTRNKDGPLHGENAHISVQITALAVHGLAVQFAEQHAVQHTAQQVYLLLVSYCLSHKTSFLTLLVR